MSRDDQSERRIFIRRRSENAGFLGHPKSQDAPKEIFDALAKQFAEYLRPNRFDPSYIEMKLPLGHPELDRLLAAAREFGLSVPKDAKEHSKGVKIYDYIVYSDAEIESAEFVQCEKHSPFIASASQIEFGPIERIASDQYIKQCKNRRFGSLVNLFHLLAVRGEAAEIIQSANLNGLSLISMVPDKGWPEGIEPLSLIWSDQKFPPLDKNCYVERLGIRLQGKQKLEKVRIDGYRVNPRLRYMTREVPDLDVALTHEQFGITPHYHGVIFSQRAKGVLSLIDENLIFKPVITKAKQATEPPTMTD